MILGHLQYYAAHKPAFVLDIRTVWTMLPPRSLNLPPLPDISHSKLSKVVKLLHSAKCIENVGTKLYLWEGIHGFVDLRRRHDAYLERRMGSDASLLQDLLWPLDSAQEGWRADLMENIVQAVEKALMYK